MGGENESLPPLLFHRSVFKSFEFPNGSPDDERVSSAESHVS